ncbi:hypothetical protein PORCRE_1664 [Porphyromonas crevioricanis JCM 15906]|uniref:Uncharacterized protein n=1 Tax=Porphyromonas crevioricanis JCM 15906 TaxID=1305617 RepID=T1DT15_9PORP|nr:hypothetical protein PORCRE_1664 [Porphyromonas crevioricanis JCM 15906]GAD08339.1 hypothetical protein PORCAN_1981 [Porphyromonas crevioricanis JCM 13913]
MASTTEKGAKKYLLRELPPTQELAFIPTGDNFDLLRMLMNRFF